MLLTSNLFPLTCFSIAAVLNTIAIMYQSLAGERLKGCCIGVCVGGGGCSTPLPSCTRAWRVSA